VSLTTTNKSRYLAVDYHRREFYLSQAQFPGNENEYRIVTVHPPGWSHGLSTGAIVGIAVGAFALVVIACGLLWWFKYRPRSKKRASRLSAKSTEQDRDVFGYYGREKDGGEETYEKRELDTAEPGMRGSIASRCELPSPPLPQYSPGSPERDWPKDRGSIYMVEMGDYLTARRVPVQSPVELSADSEHERRPPPVEIA